MMPTIDLTQGQRARVDWQDYRELAKHRWMAVWDKSTRSFYAARHARREDGKRTTVLMHRQILGLERGDGLKVDHVDHQTLDNRRRNIRVCTARQNCENKRNPSQYGVGVFKHPSRHRRKRFQAHIRVGGKFRSLGYYATPEEAQEARALASIVEGYVETKG